MKPDVSYVLAFNVLQGLAIRVKALYTQNVSLSHQDKEKIKKLFNWKTLNTLRFLAKNVCAMNREVPDYKQLVHPTIEVIKAVVNLFPAVQYFPLRLQLVRLLVEISQDCGVNVPLLDVFLSMLKTQMFTSKQKFVGGKSKVDIEVTIKISKEGMGSQDLWENIYLEVYRLMVSYLATRASSLYFPEFAVLFYRLSNSLRKITTNPAVRTHLKNFVALVRDHSKLIVSNRKGKPLATGPGKSSLGGALVEERDRLHAERNNLIKMKVTAEKDADDGDDLEDDFDA